MTEINNFNNSFGIKGVGTPKVNNEEKPEKQVADVEEKTFVQDTGVLGRSQVASPKGADVTKSVDEAVALAIQNPELMEASEEFFDKFYDDLIKKGCSAEEAYTKAAMAEAEFAETAGGVC